MLCRAGTFIFLLDRSKLTLGRVRAGDRARALLPSRSFLGCWKAGRSISSNCTERVLLSCMGLIRNICSTHRYDLLAKDHEVSFIIIGDVNEQGIHLGETLVYSSSNENHNHKTQLPIRRSPSFLSSLKMIQRSNCLYIRYAQCKSTSLVSTDIFSTSTMRWTRMPINCKTNYALLALSFTSLLDN